ncbi:MAG: hypothetical protein EXS05_10290 [Planctomycetaceae bacterium]|nr:hypothetical protein [Planctomycetaceae bacterium]
MMLALRLTRALICVVALCSLSIGGPPMAVADPLQGPPGTMFPAASPALIDAVREMLDDGFESGPKRLPAAKARFAAAQKLTKGDPRLDYAFALVLLRQSQWKPAVAQFAAAAEQPGTPYWIAWQGLIWGQFVDKQYEKGLDRLDDFAAIVSKAGPVTDSGETTEEHAETTEPQRDAASWIGQVLAVLDLLPDAKKREDLVAQHTAHLRKTLGDDLWEAVELGRGIMLGREFELAKQTAEAQSTAEKKLARRNEEQAGKLSGRLDDLDEQKEKAAKSAEDWKQWLEDNLTKSDKQLGLLEKDYNFLDKRRESLDQSITLLGRELTLLDLQTNMSNQQGVFGRNLSAEQQVIRRRNQLLNYQIEYNATIGRMSQVSQQGRVAMQQRAAIVQKYEKATGQLVKKTTDLEKWTSRANDKKQKLEVKASGKAKGAKATPDRKIVQTFKTLLPFDLEDQKAQVLEDFGLKPLESLPEKKPE